MMSIVVIEDEYMTRNGLCHLIEKLDKGYRVIGNAENVPQGLRLIKQLRPDLAVCDIRIGKSNGLDMISQLQSMGVKCHYVIVSGYPDFSYAQYAIKLGVDEYLLKPVMVDQFRETLAKLDKLISDERQQPVKIADQDKPQNEVGYSQLVVNTMRKIQESYAQPLSLQDIAAEYGVTAEYLSGLFKKEVGVSFSTCIKKARIDKALSLLEKTNMKIYEIALAVGYDDPQYFCRVFKSTLGVSPKSYLRNRDDI